MTTDTTIDTTTDPAWTDTMTTDTTIDTTTDPASTDTTTDTTSDWDTSVIDDPNAWGTVVDYSSSSTSTSTSTCNPIQVWSVLIDPATWKVVDENCDPITTTTETTTTTTDATTTDTTTNSITNSISETQNYTDSDTTTTTSVDTKSQTSEMLQSITSWDKLEEKPEWVESVNGLNPIVSDEKIESTATISKSWELDTKAKLKEAKLKERIIKWFFTLNDEEIEVDPILDSMEDIIKKINSSKAKISAKYNIDLDRIEITPNDVSTIIKLWSWSDTSNFLWVINLLPSEKLDEEKFFDVKKDHWAFKYVNILSLMDIVKWKDEAFFWAKEYITNIEALKIVMESVKAKIKSENDYEFKNFSSNHWWYKYVAAAIDEWIIDYNSSYNPNSYINRWDMLVMMMKAKKIKTYTSLTPTFSDVGPSSKYYYYLWSAQARWFVNWYDDNTFRPTNLIYRDEFSKIIYNVLSAK